MLHQLLLLVQSESQCIFAAAFSAIKSIRTRHGRARRGEEVKGLLTETELQQRRLDEGPQENWLLHAEKAEEIRRTETALRLTYRAAAVTPDDAQLSWDLGRRLIDGGEPSLGALWLEKALVTPPFDAPETTRGVMAWAPAARTDRRPLAKNKK